MHISYYPITKDVRCLKKLFVLLILALLIFLFFYSDVAALACRDGIDLFVTRVLPCILPFLIASGTLSRMGVSRCCAKLFAKPFSFLFALPGEASFAFFSGILCGNPIGAQLSADLCKQKVLDSRQAARTAALCSFVSPAFLIGAVATNMLGVPKSAIPIALGHYLGAILTGILFSLPERKHSQQPSIKVAPTPAMSPMQALIESVSSTAQVLPKICVFIAFFNVLIASLEQFGLFRVSSRIASALALSPAVSQPILTGVLEMTAGCASLSAASLPMPLLYACMSALLSFGGLCVLCQNAACTNGKAAPLLLFRIVHGALAFGITYLFC